MPHLSPIKGVVREHSGWVKWLGRAGFATRGFLYVVIGILAGLAAIGRGGKATDSQGALANVYEQPFGHAMLLLAAVGLFGYAAFTAYQALLDPEHEARDWSGVAKRIGKGLAALPHLALGVFALRLLQGGDSSPANPRAETAELFAWSRPLGQWLVGSIGASLVAFGIQQLACAWRSKLDDQLDLSGLTYRAQRLATRLSRIGIAARAVVFVVAGGFLIAAAITADPRHTKSFGESLGALRDTPMGAPLLGLMALGLLAFAMYQFIEAGFRRIAR